MKVFVAMSGGIDSSTCLYLLKKQGFDVCGLTLQLDDDYNNPIRKSKSLCERFGIEHIVLDYRKDFKREVVDEFNKQIQSGITPVPCVVCNRKIKLGKLVDFCRQNNAKLATGHYANIVEEKSANKCEYCIYRAKDRLKDQTHFLCDIKKEFLQDLIFPLGNILKSEVFRIAEQNNLVKISEYKESQEVCFFNEKTYTEYIKSLDISENSGNIIHVRTNQKLGIHNGLLKYTIGQRQGLGIAWTEPLYVVKRDFENNVLYVGEENCLYNDELEIKDINILANELYDKNEFNCQVCLRDKTPIIDAIVYRNCDKNTAKVKLKTKARAVTPGQFCAFYNGNKLLGGGEII